MREFVLVISLWGNDGFQWVYTGNQYVMQEAFTIEQCQIITNNDNWQVYQENPYYRLQFDCFHKDANVSKE